MNLERAESLSGRLVKAQPKNGTFLDTHAWVLFTREKYTEALRFIELAVGSGEANAVHLEHYGDILFRLGRTDDAVRQWEKALSMNSQNEVLRKKILNRRLN
jgi:predicted negative regulator of RcsB-dependent stress response